ncbi:MAG: GntR family transcriptional regulator [Solirubrobacteraceae bacterium]|nr:GntR family transcriptional regulator [Solirubrobacteraceae bacterium]
MRDRRTHPIVAQRRTRAAGTRLERTSSVPLYFQLAEILKERIEAGRWSPGDRFPSEREITDEFGVSRTVIRPALDLLESDGQLIRIKGRGTFVTPPKASTAVRGLIRMLSAPREDGVEVRILSAGEQLADAEVARVLELEGSRPAVAHVVALVARDGMPLAMCNSFVAPKQAPWVLPALEGRPVVGAETSLPPADAGDLEPAAVTIATAFVSEWEAVQLEMSAGGVCFLVRYVERVRRGRTARPAEFARIVYRADAVELGVRIV